MPSSFSASCYTPFSLALFVPQAGYFEASTRPSDISDPLSLHCLSQASFWFLFEISSTSTTSTPYHPQPLIFPGSDISDITTSDIYAPDLQVIHPKDCWNKRCHSEEFLPISGTVLCWFCFVLQPRLWDSLLNRKKKTETHQHGFLITPHLPQLLELERVVKPQRRWRWRQQQ